MKKSTGILLCFLLFATTIPTYSSGVLCNASKSMCTVGKYILRGQNLYTENGIMCTSNRRICTNGDSVIRGNYVEKTLPNNDKNPKKEIMNKEDVQIEKADQLITFAELYARGYMTQFEYNRELKTIDSEESIYKAEALKKVANLYEYGYINQTQFNRQKALILN